MVDLSTLIFFISATAAISAVRQLDSG